LTVNVIENGARINSLPNGASITVDFPVPADLADNNLSALFWNGSQWVEITGQKTPEGFFTITTTSPGTYLLMSK
jgi:hypothetical protein